MMRMVKLVHLLVLFLFIPLFSPEKTPIDNTLAAYSALGTIRQPLPGKAINSMISGLQLPKETTEQIEALLERYGFNGTIALAKSGEVLYRGCFGLADFTNNRPMEIDDQFQLASVSKQFTAMAVMMLAERGLLGYDDYFADHIPNFPYSMVTVRHLLHHTSGVPNYMTLMERNWIHEVPPNNEDMLKLLIEKNPPLYFTPGRRFDYSNTGYALLALLVERLSCRPFDLFLEEEIFVPLGMWDTFVYHPSFQRKGERQLTGHHRYRRSWQPTPETLHEEVLGDKGIYSTVEDMLKWDRALLRGALVSQPRLIEAFQPTSLKNGRSIQYGFGFRIEENPEERVVFHYGRWNSFSSCIFRNLDNEYTLIMLSNIKRNLDPIQRRIRELLPTEPPQVVDVWLSRLNITLYSMILGLGG